MACLTCWVNFKAFCILGITYIYVCMYIMKALCSSSPWAYYDSLSPPPPGKKSWLHSCWENHLSPYKSQCQLRCQRKALLKVSCPIKGCKSHLSCMKWLLKNTFPVGIWLFRVSLAVLHIVLVSELFLDFVWGFFWVCLIALKLWQNEINIKYKPHS